MGRPCIKLGNHAEIVSQMMPVVERKEGGFERGSQILQRGSCKEEGGACHPLDALGSCDWEQKT